MSYNVKAESLYCEPLYTLTNKSYTPSMVKGVLSNSGAIISEV